MNGYPDRGRHGAGFDNSRSGGYGEGTRPAPRAFPSSRAATQAPPPAPPSSRVPLIEVSDIRPLQGDGPTRAYLTLRIGPLEVRDVRYVEPSGRSPFVCPPQSSWESQGQRKYRDLVVWPAEWRDAITDAVQREYQAYTGRGGKQNAANLF